MFALLAFIAQDYVLRDLQKTPVAAHGPFKLEREDCIARDPPVAVLHYAPCRAIARLSWPSADGQLTITYEDNGRELIRTFSFPISLKMPDSCSLGDYTAYQAKPGSDASWHNSEKGIVATLVKCSRLTSSQIASYKGEFLAATPYYNEAATGLRSLAVSMFGNLRRCTAQKQVSRNPMDGFTCIREEGPAS
ncbi:hypothetical protein [Sphingomonas sp. BK481]|uniref:hypothetical protein n=1 Tax=Sphingomonas sp. BK481 TaxID=2586981 RepID=UPI00160CB56F|nr:hypothetical protein [Sphingomonas sp. BK481]MBB3588990.1 hypothetical protein [Sphingomonas sp. BK481]